MCSNDWIDETSHPCTQHCKDRKVGCKKGCEKLLMYNIFHEKQDCRLTYKPTYKFHKREEGFNKAFVNRRKRNHTYLCGK